MAISKLVLVAGATGQQGGAVVDALLKRGHKLRALTRKPDSPAARLLLEKGVDICPGDLTNRDSVMKAVHGVDAVFAMTTPFEEGVVKEVKQGFAMVDAVKSEAIGHLVFSSVASANRNTGISHFESKQQIEKYIVESRVPYTIIGPVSFMDNVMQAQSIETLCREKIVRPLAPGRRVQKIAVADIGTFAAAVIERRETMFGKRIDIAGDELTGIEEAEVLSLVTGKRISYEPIPLQALRSQNEDLASMFEWLDHVGYSVEIKNLHRRFPEVNWHNFGMWARKQDWSVLQSAVSV